jgi:hypothetical protein
MNRRTRRTLTVVAAVLVLLAVALFLRWKSPPEAARILPESDGILYIKLKPMRSFFHKEWKPPQRVPDYQHFVDATGIDWERDLDEAAIALHRMPDPNGPNGPVAYSMVLRGKITGEKLNQWLEANATQRENYEGKIIYDVPSEGRTVRVSQIGYDMVAISNFPTPEMIHSMIDRHRTAAWPLTGSTLLGHHYRDIPLLSVAWGMGQIGLPLTQSGAIHIFGLDLPLPIDSTFVASIAPGLSLKNLHLRVEEFAKNDDAAASEAAALATLITAARQFTAPLGENAANDALKDLLKNAEVTQSHDRVIIKADLPVSVFSSLAAAEQNNVDKTAPE